MSFGLGFSFPNWQTLSGGAFSPAQLFQGGVQGAWYDPSDSGPTGTGGVGTLFSDRAGTTPCATPGAGAVVPVGLMLDKSQGLVLGSELVGSPTYASGWAAQSGVTLPGTGAVYTNAPNNNSAYTSISPNLVLGRFFSVTYTIDSISAGGLSVYCGGAVSTAVRTVAGTYTELIGTTAVDQFVALRAVGTTTATISRFSVKQVLGNHAIAANDTTARPELSARVNLLTYSEEFDNGAWGKTGTTVTANIATAPNGTTTADSFSHTTTSGFPNINQAFAFEAITYACSIYFKYVSNQWVRVDQGSFIIWFDVLNGVVGSTGGSLGTLVSSSVVPAGNGWYKCTFIVAKSAQNSVVQIQNVDADNSSNRVSGTSTLIWGADLRPANIGTTIPAYQRIADQYTYDNVGFPRYLAFNGTSSAMSTPANVNLSGTDKATVFAGVRKLSDAALAVVCEQGPNPAGTYPAFSLWNGDPSVSGAGARWGAISGGSTGIGTATAASFASPISNVLTLASNISAPSLSIRANGVSAASSSNSQGVGNFGSNPLYVGARTNSSFWLNGNIYSLIVAGSAVSAGNITATEQWVAGKTGITI